MLLPYQLADPFPPREQYRAYIIFVLIDIIHGTRF